MRKVECMHTRFWRRSLSGQAAAKKLVVKAIMLALVVSALTTNLFSAQPVAAATVPTQQHTTITSLQAQDSVAVQSLDVFGNWHGTIYNKWSYDNGASWSAWVAAPNNGFTGTPAVVSEGDGYLRLFSRNSFGQISFNVLSGLSRLWGSWSLLPAQGLTSGNLPMVVNVTNSSEVWIINSDPAVASWGPGRMDVFIVARSFNTGGYGLLHTWAVNNTWVNKWEVLGTGYLQGNPAAVSTASGGIDVFVDDFDNELVHKWFNGSWSSGWDDLGGILTSSPTVSSSGAGYLNLFVRNTNNGLSQRAHWPSGWGGWWNIDSNTINSAPAGAEQPGYIHLFALDNNGHMVYNHWFNQWWFGWSVFDSSVWTYAPAAVGWTFAGLS